MTIEDKIRRIGKRLKQARHSGNFRRIHKWENKMAHAARRAWPWNPLAKCESLFRIKKRIDALELRTDYHFEDYTWDWCGLCRDAFVRCPHCSNNCCNASYGKVRQDGSLPQPGDEGLADCPVCKTAYDVQEFAYRLGKEPKRESFPHADQVESEWHNDWCKSFEWIDEEENRQSDGAKALFTATSEELGRSAVENVTKVIQITQQPHSQ